MANEVMPAGTQFRGRAGFVRELAVERMCRDARVLMIGGDVIEVMPEEVAKGSIIAEER